MKRIVGDADDNGAFPASQAGQITGVGGVDRHRPWTAVPKNIEARMRIERCIRRGTIGIQKADKACRWQSEWCARTRRGKRRDQQRTGRWLTEPAQKLGACRGLDHTAKDK